jgi:putative two-component system hydrogenase maturation factor HypX/HoxX
MMTESFVQSNNYDRILESKVLRRSHDEYVKPLKYYRQEELRQMRDNFYRPNSPYHAARKNFVLKAPATETPERLALHRHDDHVSENILPFRENSSNPHQASGSH